MLSQKETRVLDFENSWWLYPEPKDRAIREYVGMSSSRYYQVLRRLVDDDAAVDEYPLVVRRLRRMRKERKEAVAKRIDTTVG